MKKITNILKDNILTIIISIIIGCTMEITANNSVPSFGVSYSSDKTNETTVNGALNELFNVVDLNEQIAGIKTRIQTLEDTTTVNSLVNILYPIGSIYITTSNINPSTVFTGTTWERYGVGKTLVSTDGTSGRTGGSNTVTLTTANLPIHKHSIPALSGTAASAGDHTHTVSGTVSSSFTGSGVTTSEVDINHIHAYSGNTGNQSANHTHGIPALSGTAASAGAHTHKYDWPNPTAHIASGNESVNFGFVYTGAWTAYDTTSAGAHTHSVTTTASTTGGISANHNHSYSGNTGYMSANNKHTHTVTAAGSVSSSFSNGSAASNGAHTHNVSTVANNTGNTGSGTEFSVQNPYITVYMWKRTA